MKTKVLYAVRIGQPSYMEELITDKAANIEKAKEWAVKNGFDRLRIAEIDLNEKPDFVGTIGK